MVIILHFFMEQSALTGHLQTPQLILLILLLLDI